VAPSIEHCGPGYPARAFGDAGDDRLVGGKRTDVLIGGPGFDTAEGGRAGRDRCEAERIEGRGCRRTAMT